MTPSPTLTSYQFQLRIQDSWLATRKPPHRGSPSTWKPLGSVPGPKGGRGGGHRGRLHLAERHLPVGPCGLRALPRPCHSSSLRPTDGKSCRFCAPSLPWASLLPAFTLRCSFLSPGGPRVAPLCGMSQSPWSLAVCQPPACTSLSRLQMLPPHGPKPSGPSPPPGAPETPGGRGHSSHRWTLIVNAPWLPRGRLPASQPFPPRRPPLHPARAPVHQAVPQDGLAWEAVDS